MSNRPSDIELAFSIALARRGAAYLDAYSALEALQARLHAGDSLHRLCPELQQVLTMIRSADDQLAPLQQEWELLNKAAGPELAVQIQSHRTQLEHTLALVDRLTASAQADRSLLAPRLDEAARGRRMQAAYAASGGY
jgi:hypothetical protein